MMSQLFGNSYKDGQDALELVQTELRIDLVLSDLTMPRLQGPELLSRVKQISPQTALMLMSAFPPADMPADARFIGKPFLPDDLLAKVQETLAKAAQARSELSQTCERAQRLHDISQRSCAETQVVINRSKELLKKLKRANSAKSDPE